MTNDRKARQDDTPDDDVDPFARAFEQELDEPGVRERARFSALNQLLPCPLVASRNNPIWVELLQLVPILSLALPFILQGKVDLSRAAFGFALGALLNLPIYALILRRGYVFNPILLGAALWLGLGGVAFNVPIEPVANWLSETQAFGLFLGAFAVGVVTTFLSPRGYTGCSSGDRRWVRGSSLSLLALTLTALAWAWLFRRDVRLGGGAPFIVLNVARRVLIARAPRYP